MQVPNLKQPWSPAVKLVLENGDKQEEGKAPGTAAQHNNCCDSNNTSQMSRTQLANVLAQQLLVEHQELGVSALKVANDGTVELQLEEERASTGTKLQTSPSTKLAAPAEAAAYKLAKQVRMTRSLLGARACKSSGAGLRYHEWYVSADGNVPGNSCSILPWIFDCYVADM
jgi:hypothetical protein